MLLQTHKEVAQFFTREGAEAERLAFVYVISWNERMGRKWPRYSRVFLTWEARAKFYQSLCDKGNEVRDVHLESSLVEN